MSRSFFYDDKVLGLYLVTGDHVVNLFSSILEQHISLHVLDMYALHTRKRPDPLQIQCYKYHSLAF